MPARKFDGLVRQACVDAGERPGVPFAMSACVTRFAHLLVLVGCGPTPNATLADLPDLRVGVIVDNEVDSDDDNTRPSKVLIGLHYDEDAFRSEHGDCATLEGGEGTINGVSLELESPGDRDKEIDECNHPYFGSDTFFLGAFEPGRLELGDGTLQISATFEGDPFGARIAKPVAPSTWNLRAGEPFAFSWSHTPDLAGITPDRVAIHFKQGYHRGDKLTVTEVTDSEIRGVAPSVPEYTGEGTLEILLLGASSTWDVATTCVGAAECNCTSYRLYDHVASLTL
jgi:hypothetical protein